MSFGLGPNVAGGLGLRAQGLGSTGISLSPAIGTAPASPEPAVSCIPCQCCIGCTNCGPCKPGCTGGGGCSTPDQFGMPSYTNTAGFNIGPDVSPSLGGYCCAPSSPTCCTSACGCGGLGGLNGFGPIAWGYPGGSGVGPGGLPGSGVEIAYIGLMPQTPGPSNSLLRQTIVVAPSLPQAVSPPVAMHPPAPPTSGTAVQVHCTHAGDVIEGVNINCTSTGVTLASNCSNVTFYTAATSGIISFRAYGPSGTDCTTGNPYNFSTYSTANESLPPGGPVAIPI